MTKADYVLTSDVDQALIPLDTLRERLGISRWTLDRRLTGITRHPFNHGKAVKWGDIKHLFAKAPIQLNRDERNER